MRSWLPSWLSSGGQEHRSPMRAAALALVAFFTPRTEEQIREARQRVGRRPGDQMRRRRIRKLARAARRIRAVRHPKSGRAA